MQMLIGGKDISSADERWIPVINPANGRQIDRVPEGTLYEVKEAVQAAESAFDGWAAKTPRERGVILHRTAAIVRAYEAAQRGEIERTGVMVHLVPDEQVDAGPVVAVAEVPIRSGESLEELEARVHEVEHRLLVEAIRTVVIGDPSPSGRP